MALGGAGVKRPCLWYPDTALFSPAPGAALPPDFRFDPGQAECHNTAINGRVAGAALCALTDVSILYAYRRMLTLPAVPARWTLRHAGR